MSLITAETFEGLLPALIHVATVVNSEDAPALQHKQDVAQAANAFKDRLSKARETLNNLPGGEMLPSDQDQIIALLKELRDRKRRQLTLFASMHSSNM